MIFNNQDNNKSYNRYNKNKTTKLSIYHEITSIHQLSKIAMVFWIGGSCMAGVVFFPLIFKLIDQVAASQLVGQMLHILAYIGIVCLFIALVEVMLNHRLALFKTRRFWYILIMNLFLIIDYFAILPSIYTIRQKIASMAHSIISVQNNVFDFWHSLSAIMFFIICIFGILYLLEM